MKIEPVEFEFSGILLNKDWDFYKIGERGSNNSISLKISQPKKEGVAILRKGTNTGTK